MYMNKTSISWSVWEGERLGVSTFLTNPIKCTQGWIFYLFGFFFRTPPYRALDFWTRKITTNFTNIQVAKPPQRCKNGDEPALPLPLDTAEEGWSQKAETSPQNSQTCLHLITGMVVSFSMSHPTITLPWQGDIYFQGEHSYLMGNISFVWKSVWNIPGLEWCRKLWQNIRSMFSSLDISALPEIKPFW